MYCNNCGANLPEGTKFCTNCGSDSGAATQPAKAQPQPQPANIQYSGTQPYAPPPTTHLKEKEPILALVLSWFILMGSGHMYAGKVGKGFGLMLGGFISGAIVTVGYVLLLFLYTAPGLSIALMIIGGISAMIIALYAHIDAYRTAKKYNLFLQTNGRPPTSNDDW